MMKTNQSQSIALRRKTNQWKQYIWIVLTAVLAGACSSSEEEVEDCLADPYSIGLHLAIHDSHGQNLLASGINGDSLSNYTIRFEFDGVPQDFDSLRNTLYISKYYGEPMLDMVPMDLNWYLFFKRPKPFRYTVRLTAPEVFRDEKEHTIDAKMVDSPEGASYNECPYLMVPDPNSVFVDGIKATPLEDTQYVAFKVQLPIAEQP